MGVMGNHETTPQRLSRFELRRVLGQGAQASVWLAFDPHLEREVAVKILRRGGLGATGDDAQWLHEARSVSRLTTPTSSRCSKPMCMTASRSWSSSTWPATR